MTYWICLEKLKKNKEDDLGKQLKKRKNKKIDFFQRCEPFWVMVDFMNKDSIFFYLCYPYWFRLRKVVHNVGMLEIYTNFPDEVKKASQCKLQVIEFMSQIWTRMSATAPTPTSVDSIFFQLFTVSLEKSDLTRSVL